MKDKKSTVILPDTKPKKNLTPKESEYAPYPDISNIASTDDTTGLMSTPPQNEDEFEALQELSGMQLPKKKKS